jgi:hypothetical protein
LLVGVHPDEATDEIVDFGISHQKPFVILPCCVCEDQFPERKLKSGNAVRTFSEFIEYLMEKHPDNEQVRMGYLGPNLVIFNEMQGKGK